MSNDIDEIVFDADIGSVSEPRLYESPIRFVTTAHPFSDADLRAFQSAGEHTGLD
ncbi:hypothetical protein GCM10027413_20070 [Conyzicola nivalis]|uniref:Uncharacterized protein n=1 Tax=Conyzicola nivalis TaxID=1477021 RepID=A0A916SDH1_9MICO|nr:hypothetical protein [Conyzicola nivalis]GGA94755.1 hypothetical protein GCM10010979_06550 [Conyzicola nivalis]